MKAVLAGLAGGGGLGLSPGLLLLIALGLGMPAWVEPAGSGAESTWVWTPGGDVDGDRRA